MPKRSTVPLNLLQVSPLNVRKTDADREIAELAADIRAHGLINNLVAIKPKALCDLYEVVAGARRLAALQLLASQGHIAADWKVPLLVEERDDGREISLAENVQRIAMNPVDEFEAYRQIVEDHPDQADAIAYCANRQGVSRRHVEQALRLAQLAPAVLEALRSAEIDVATARAYAAVPDQALQLQVFQAEQKRGLGPKHLARNVRDALVGRTYPADGPKARYVGLEAYRAAGGRVERDLFMAALDVDLLLDPAILDDLVRAKAWGEVQSVAEGDGFSSGLVATGIGRVAAGWPKAPAGDWLRTDHFLRPLHHFPEEERAPAIGVYVLAEDGAGLQWLGAYSPKLAPPALLPNKPAPPRAATAAESTVAGRHHVQPQPSQMEALSRYRDLSLAAGRIAVEQLVGDLLEDRGQWPEGQGFVPAITTAIGDDDTFLIAVQIRVARGELEAAMPDAQAQRDAEDEARDLVTAGAGGGGVLIHA